MSNKTLAYLRVSGSAQDLKNQKFEILDSRFGSVGRQYAEMLVYMRTYKDITFLACAYIAETA